MQQRGIPESVVNVLIEYGSRRYDHQGAQILFFDHRAKRRYCESKGSDGMRKIEKYSDVCLVRSIDGELVTIGHRYKRLPLN
jgi:hypothetical protein